MEIPGVLAGRGAVLWGHSEGDAGAGEAERRGNRRGLKLRVSQLSPSVHG